jgi:hypothetical protein
VPVSPAQAERLAAGVARHYADAEATLIARIARNLRAGIAAPEWAATKLAQLEEYRRQAERVLADLQKKAAEGIITAITEAYESGGLSAVADMKGLGMGAGVEYLGGLRAIEALVREALGNVLSTHLGILRSVMDVYRDVIAESSSGVLLGNQTRLQAAQAALNRFAQRGILGFVDKAGRNWTMQSYVEMALRTGCGRAAVQGHVDRLTANGLDLVMVSDAPKECPLCREWEGKVLSLSGTDVRYPSLDEARAARLMHCNCRHSVSAYIPGVTKPMGDVADPEGYVATQQLRYLECQTRASKRLQAAAMDDAAAQAASVRVREYQRKIRELVASTTAKRRRHRERLGAL